MVKTANENYTYALEKRHLSLAPLMYAQLLFYLM